MLPHQAEEAPRRKRKLSAERKTSNSPPLPSTNRRKREQKQFHGPPPEFWDNLSRLWLTPRALREFDRRTRQPDVPQRRNPGDNRVAGAPSLKQFARQGGPDLSLIRGYPEPRMSPSPTQSMSSSQSHKRKADEMGISASSSPNKTPKTGKSTAYDKAFAQNLEDHGIYVKVDYSNKPQNLEDIDAALMKRRRSLPPSQFDRDAFRKFRQENDDVHTKDDVKATVLRTITGSTNIPASRNVEFNNLAPLTNGAISNIRADYYEGSRPAGLKKRVRDDTGKYIVPSTDTGRPCLPNFFVEVEGPNSTGNVLRRQACYAGAMGARAMHELRRYIDETAALDGNAYSITWIYNSSSGTLILYTTHPTASVGSERTVDYRMTHLKSFALTNNPDTFRQGASAFRNARDWARERRRELMDAANKKT